MESQIRTVGLLITLVAVLYALRRGGYMPALVFVILAPLKYFAQNVGIELTPAKLIGLLYLGFIILNPGHLSQLKNKYFLPFISYYIYTIYLTLGMAIFWPDHSVAAQNFMYGNTMRGFVQIFQVLMGLAIVAVMMSGLTSAYSLFKVQVALLLTMIFISIYGIYVWFAQRAGLPFNPLIRQGGLGGVELGRVIHHKIDGVYVMRAYSLTGEPKSLASNTCLGVVLTYFTPATRIRF